jgi:hypothetical protein
MESFYTYYEDFITEHRHQTSENIVFSYARNWANWAKLKLDDSISAQSVEKYLLYSLNSS